MIKQMNTRHRNVLGASFSFLVAAALVSTSPSARATVDPQILAARTAAQTASIEAIGTIAKDTADKFGTGEIKMTGKPGKKNVKTLSAGLADAIIAKPSANPPTPTDPNRLANKADEIGEVGAFIQDGLQANPKYLKKGGVTGAKITLTMLKGLFSTAKQTAELFGTTVFRDAAGSVALTIANDPALDAVQAKVQKTLSKTRLVKKLAGKTNVAAIKQGFTEGFAADPTQANLKYEDGNIDALTTVQDPETDIRPA